MNSNRALRVEPQRHPLGRGWLWIRSGFDIFNKGMGPSVAMLLLWLGIGLLIEQLPAGGFISQLLYMVWMAGWMVVAKGGDEQGRLTFSDLFAGFRHRLTLLVMGGLLTLGLFTLVVMLCLGLLSLWGLEDIFSQDPEQLTLTVEQARGVLLCLLVGMALLVPVLMAVTFAPALIYFHDVSVWQAARLSFQGCLRNMWPFLWWGLLGCAMLLLGTLLMLIGLLVVLPALNYSIYMAYQDIFLAPREEGEPLPMTGFEA
ncbi:BPSS1780 family membrane protein [Aeromonas sobria]|uniref:BPSS1780 family membrane protein n=1 Tax=Aeromonas sobria TaxID=646 RepID=UPI003CFE38B9